MEQVTLGRSGLKVSRICLGCMSYGDPASGHHQWALGEEASRPFIKEALELGVTFFDTANMYSYGASEEILGRAIRDFARREELVVATKLFFPMRKGDPNSGGLSRKAVMREVDASLRRLGTDYVDLLQVHRWDYATPVEESLEALHDVVKAGKARYLGASSMHAWQFMKALGIQERRGWARFISMQPHYNLLYREEEREMLPLCRSEGIGVIPWSPLARGRLARPWGGAETDRTKYDKYGKGLYGPSEAADRPVVEALEALARERGLPMVRLALAWLLSRPGVTAPIVGATRPGQLADAAAALEVSLSPEESAALEAAYRPHAIAGFD
jgi:aryl-alcohol dehydrogenase-like predicted oxidoreductase